MAFERKVSRFRSTVEQKAAYTDAQIAAGIKEFQAIDSARKSAKTMKVVGTVGLFAFGSIAAVAALVASGGIAAPTAVAVMALAESSGVLSGISAALAGIGIGREAFNKRQLKKVQETYDLAA